MPDAYTFIADAPVTLANDAPPTSRIQVAELGTFQDPRYGRFSITASAVANWARLLAQHFQGRVPIDLDHSTDKGGPSEAAGWITSLTRDGNRVHATVEWTPLGESAVREKRYLYISPTFTDALKDKTGRTLGPALLRAALTNNPFLRDMPAVSLSADLEPPTLAQRIADTPDSRPVMADLTKIAKALSLDADASEEQILAKLAERTAEPKTLEAQASDAGKVLLDADEAKKLRADAEQVTALSERVVTLEKQAADAEFNQAIEKARADGRLDAKTETVDRLRKLYDADPATCLEHIAELPKVANVPAAGARTVEQPAGDGDRADLAERAERYLLDNKLPDTAENYKLALEAVA